GAVRGARPGQRGAHVPARPGQPGHLRPALRRVAHALQDPAQAVPPDQPEVAMTGPGVPEGMLSLDELHAAVRLDEIETVIVGFTDHYGRLVGKRYDAGMFVDEVAENGTHGCDYLLTTDME